MVRVIRNWWPERDGQAILRVCVGHWRELGWWPVPGRIFQWSGYLPDLWYFLKCLVWHRYDRVQIDTLPPTWNEWDGKLMHASMAVFSDYMSRDSHGRWSVEQIDAELAKSDTDEHSRAWFDSYRPIAAEMEAIYRWWTVERAREQQEEADALMTWHGVFQAAGGIRSVPTENPRLAEMVFPESEEADRLQEVQQAIERRNEAKDEEMLIRLMKTRTHLWT